MSINAKAAAENQTPPSKQPRSGKELWATVQTKMHDYHSVTHELHHRAQEKAGFAVAEGVLSRVATYAVQAAQDPLLAEAARKAGKKWWKKMGKALKSVGRKLRPKKAASQASHAVAHHVHHAHHAAHPTGLVGHSLHAVHVALPVLGTYLLAHMAHHDWHRAQSEWKQHRSLTTTTLFCLGAFWDAVDAIAHLIVVLCLVLPESEYLNHDVEHALHAYSMVAAMYACAAMVIGEALSARWYGGHGHGHGHGHHEAKPVAQQQHPLLAVVAAANQQEKLRIERMKKD